MSVLLSYPRSGNHLVRFFIELLTETPTNGCSGNNKDIPIYLNKFPKEIPFNINKLHKYENNNIYQKYHTPPEYIPNILIFIVRNPNEVLLRNSDYKMNIKWFDNYFSCIDYYNNFLGKKLLLFYEDIITDKITFIKTLYEFLNIKYENKKNYVLENIDELYKLSSLGTNRAWGGINSNHVNYYYNKIPITIKENFDNYITNKLKTNKYDILKLKYAL
jgi:hypothetical protein